MPSPLSPIVSHLPKWIRLGLGDEEFHCEEKGATFPADTCPEVMPSLTNHHNIMSEVLRENPELYHRLRHVKSKGGVTLAKCLKTGMDNKGHPMIKTVGFVCGDEDCYRVFWPLLKIIISRRHNIPIRELENFSQATDLDWRSVSTQPMDPTGRHVISTRVRTGRSLRSFALPPSMTREKRRELERLVVRALTFSPASSSEDRFRTFCGSYLPLHGSTSCPQGGTTPFGMGKEREENLRSRGMLFQEPDSTLLLSSGFGRHWPDARGMFLNDDENFIIWANEEDHLRIISMQNGSDIQGVFRRFAEGILWVEERLKALGTEFMHSQSLGHLLTCPSNLGTGMRASVMIRLPRLSRKHEFKRLVDDLQLQARGVRGVDSSSIGGVYDISNRDRLGRSEVELCNIMIQGVVTLVKLEIGEEEQQSARSKL
eukprot:GEMP01033045.1.p1 GENE.GEMP01033045.1~~GEMP01033045.1.p1  ORF type:complete len:428 (+),score=87.33 GEMP01033045.1:126-1409(+)